MKEKIQQLIQFLTHGIWRIRAGDLTKWRFALIQYLRTFILAIRGFASDACSLRASALTFYTIMSIVPVVALVFGIAKGFEMEEALKTQLENALKDQKEVVQWVTDFSDRLLAESKKAKGGVVAGVGVALLFWSVIKALGNIEKAFNHIWGVVKHRSLVRKFSDYVSMLLMSVVLLVIAQSATVAMSGFITRLLDRFDITGMVRQVIVGGLSVLPFCLLWVLFTFVYLIMPNTKVRFRSALFAGVMAGTIFQILNWAYVGFQVGMAKYNAVYGSFAALPLFLIWLQLSWLVVLFGAELSFAHQNVETYEFEPDCARASNRFKRLVTLRVAQYLIHNFAEGGTPKTAMELTHEFGIPIRLINEILERLVSGGVLSEARMGDAREIGYQPARAIDEITIAFVIDALDRQGTDDVPIVRSEQLEKIAASLEAFDDSMKQSPANMALRDI